jgi:hypothetical protein
MQRTVVQLDACPRGVNLGRRCRSLLLERFERGQRGGVLLAL